MPTRPGTSLRDPAAGIVPITASDTVDITYNGTVTQSRALIITVSGTVKLTDANGVIGIVTLPAGQFSIRASRIWSTSTTATGISALL